MRREEASAEPGHMCHITAYCTPYGCIIIIIIREKTRKRDTLQLLYSIVQIFYDTDKSSAIICVLHLTRFHIFKLFRVPNYATVFVT